MQVKRMGWGLAKWEGGEWKQCQCYKVERINKQEAIKKGKKHRTCVKEKRKRKYENEETEEK